MYSKLRICVLVIGMTSSVVLADPVEWAVSAGGNGHRYEVIKVASTWAAAHADCQARGGHLVTIGSAAENSFVFDLIKDDPSLWFIDGAGNGEGPWIGLTQQPGAAEPAGGFGWTTGEPLSYTNWSSGEPNNSAGDEAHGLFFAVGTLIGSKWNDGGTNGTANAYIIEYEKVNIGQIEWPTSVGGSGHRYEVVKEPGGISWDDAHADCQSRGAHLVTITSATENAFVYDLIKGDSGLWFSDAAGNGQGPWIGLIQMDGANEPGAGWVWTTNEFFSYNNWATGEPNNTSGTESRGQFFAQGKLIDDKWNDVGPAPYALVKGYVIEYENVVVGSPACGAGVSTACGTGTMAMLPLMCLGCLRRRRLRRDR